MSNVKKNQAGRWLIRFALLFGIVSLISLKLYIHFEVDLLNKDIRTLEQQKNQLLSERERMRAEVKRLQNIDRISSIAEQKLNLINDPEPVHTIRLENFNRLRQFKQEFAARKGKNRKNYSLAGIR